MIALDSSRQIKLGALISYGTIFFNIVAGLLYTPWMIRTIGRADYGLFALTVSILACITMDFGIGSAIARFIAKYRAENREDKVTALLATTIKLYLLIDLLLLIVVTIVFFFIENIYSSLSPEDLGKFKVVFCVAGLFGIVSFPFLPLNSILIAYERFVVLKSCNFLKKFLTVALMVVVLLAGYGLYALVAVNALVGITIIVFQCIYICRNVPAKLDLSCFDYGLLKELFYFCFWLTIILVAQSMFLNMSPTVIGMFSGADEIGVFAIGMTINGYIQAFAVALGGLFLPKISRMTATNNHSEINRLLIKVGRLQLIAVGLLFCGFIAIGQEFLALWLGQGFEHSYYVLLFIAAPGMITYSQQIAYTSLLVTKKLTYRAISLIVGVIICISISIILAPRFGAIGVAVGVCAGMMFCAAAMNIFFHRVLKMDIREFFFQCHLKILPSFLLALGTGYLVGKYVPASSLVTFMPKAALLGALYAIIVWLFAMNTYEKQLAMSIARRIPGLGKLLS